DTLKCACKSSPFGGCPEDTIECPSQNDRCLAATLVTVAGDKVSEGNFKSCLMPELCFDVSINNGVFAFLLKSSCCSGDLCNNHTNYPKTESKSPPNGKKCFSCDGDKNCMKTLNCVGDENYCVKVTGNAHGVSVMTKGCASKVVCSDHFSSLVNKLTSQVSDQFTEAKVSCCQGDYCNSASSVSPALLLL
ncbi:hypothetical protein CCH79_00020591, partial [Gambusia affinis]